MKKAQFASIPECITHVAKQMARELDAEDAAQSTQQRFARTATTTHPLAQATLAKELQLLGLTLN